jgi:hypothetical protein
MTQQLSTRTRPFTYWLAMLAALGVILSQLLDVPAAWHEHPIVGAIEVIEALLFVVLAYFWTTTKARWPWIVGGLVSLVALGGIIFTRTVGIGGGKADVGNWGEPVTVVAMVSYVLMMVAAVLHLRSDSRH